MASSIPAAYALLDPISNYRGGGGSGAGAGAGSRPSVICPDPACGERKISRLVSTHLVERESSSPHSPSDFHWACKVCLARAVTDYQSSDPALTAADPAKVFFKCLHCGTTLQAPRQKYRAAVEASPRSGLAPGAGVTGLPSLCPSEHRPMRKGYLLYAPIPPSTM